MNISEVYFNKKYAFCQVVLSRSQDVFGKLFVFESARQGVKIGSEFFDNEPLLNGIRGSINFY